MLLIFIKIIRECFVISYCIVMKEFITHMIFLKDKNNFIKIFYNQ